MELLKKNIHDEQNPRNDNSDKKELFAEGHRPHSANEHKEEWSFIEDKAIRENIAYQMQYLEFQVRLYNDYRIYLTVESLLSKNIMAVIGGVIECALYDLVSQGYRKIGRDFDKRTQFLKLIDDAYDMQIIDVDLRDDFHELRKVRNLVHLSSLDFREYSAYTIDEANEHIEALNRFIEQNKS